MLSQSIIVQGENEKMGYIYHESNSLGGSMSLDDKKNNATEIFNQLSSYGWTLNAICGVLGNIERESYINPAQWQVGYSIGSSNAGFGLVQWTPSTKYTSWATSNGHNIYDGYWQVHCMDKQSYGTEWIQTSGFPITYEEYKESTESIEYLTEAFLKNYERAGVEALSDRIAKANYWYQYLQGMEPVDPVDPEEPEHPDPELGDVFPLIKSSSYNMNRLTEEEISIIKTLSLNDVVKFAFTFNRSKKDVGITFTGKRLTIDNKNYTIESVRNNGYLVVRNGVNGCIKIVNPKLIKKGDKIE